MSGIILNEPGGVGLINPVGDAHAAGVAFIGVMCYLSFSGTTTSWTWALTTKPAGSNAVLSYAAIDHASARAPTFTCEIVGDYQVQFTDSSGASYTLDVSATTEHAFAASGISTIIYGVNYNIKARSQFSSDAAADAYGATNSAGLAAAIVTMNASGGPGILYLPPSGDIYVDSTFEVPSSSTDITIIGAGQLYADVPRTNYGSFFRASSRFPLGAPVVKFNSVRGCKLDNVGIDGCNKFVYTADASTDTCTAVAHGMVNGQKAWFDTSGSQPGGITTTSSAIAFYIINKTADTFQLAMTFGGSAIDITSAGTGTQYCHPGRAGIGLEDTANVSFGNQSNCFDRVSVRGVLWRTLTFTANASTDVCSATAHGFTTNQQVYLSNSGGALPAGLVVGTMNTGTRYYIVNPTTDTFQLSASASGSAVNIAGAGTGVHAVCGLGYAVHVGGYATGIQVSNTYFSNFRVTECDVGYYQDGQSGTTDIKLNSWLLNNQAYGIVADTGGELGLEHVNIEGAGFPGDAILVRPAFGSFDMTACRLELSGEGINFPDGSRGYPSTIRNCTIQFTNIKLPSYDAATNVITYSRHQLVNDDRIDFINDGGALPTGIVLGTRYYIISATTDTFKISATSGGAEINFTDAGTGNNWYRAKDKIIDFNHSGVLKIDMCLIYCANNPLASGYVDIPGHTNAGTVIISGVPLTNTVNVRNRGAQVVLIGEGSATTTATDPELYAPIFYIYGGGLYISHVSPELSGASTPVGGWVNYVTSDVLKWADATASHPVVLTLSNTGLLNVQPGGSYQVNGKQIASLGSGADAGIAFLAVPDGAGFINVGNNPALTGRIRMGKVSTNGQVLMSVLNQAGNVDLQVLTHDTSNNLIVGDPANAGTVIESNGEIALTPTSVTARLRVSATGLGFFGHAPAAQPSAYTVTNPTTDRALNVTADTLAQVAQVVGTLIADLQTLGLIP